jgi:hypothetical protein
MGEFGEVVHENRAFRGQRDGIDEVVHEMGHIHG